MAAFAETGVCRRKFILNYFGETMDDDCGFCENCKRDRETFKGMDLALKALEAAKQTNERFRLDHLVSVLIGEKTDYVESNTPNSDNTNRPKPADQQQKRRNKNKNKNRNQRPQGDQEIQKPQGNQSLPKENQVPTQNNPGKPARQNVAGPKPKPSAENKSGEQKPQEKRKFPPRRNQGPNPNDNSNE